MVALDVVRTANARLQTRAPGLTAIFVGGTSGIGRSTLLQLAEYSPSPHAYIIGRSAANAAPLLSDLRRISPAGRFDFIEADVSLIKNVDRACEVIKQSANALDILFMTPGGMSMAGRTDTAEGIDYLFALRYYSRMRFVHQLLPLLQQSPHPRVVSVFGGGWEAGIDTSDLELQHKYSPINCALHSISMTTLAFEHIANLPENKNVGFVHTYPGIVGTNIARNSFGPLGSVIWNYLIWPLMWPISVNLQESGERNLFLATADRYARGRGRALSIGSDGMRGSGVYLANWRGETSTGNETLRRMRSQGLAEKVWLHTETLLTRAAGQ